MKVLIAGGAGFIGSHLCDYLLDKDCEIICMDDLITGNEENLSKHFDNPRFKFIKHNVSEYIDSESEKFNRMVGWIRDDLGVTSLRYQTLDDMVRAIGLPRESLCLYCWSGK